MFDGRIKICHQCPHRQHRCAGPCSCTLDGRDIIEHVNAGQCPEDRFSGEPIAPPRPSVRLAGDVVEALAERIGADRAADRISRMLRRADCGCRRRKEFLNNLDRRLRRILGLPGGNR